MSYIRSYRRKFVWLWCYVSLSCATTTDLSSLSLLSFFLLKGYDMFVRDHLAVR